MSGTSRTRRELVAGARAAAMRSRPPLGGKDCDVVSKRRSRVLAALAVVAGLLAVVAVAAYAYDHARRDTLAPGMRVGGVAVGGMRVDPARREVIARAVRPLRRTVEVRAAGRTFLLSAREAGLDVDVDAALDRALRDSRRGWIGARVARGITGARTQRDFALVKHVDPKALSRFTRRVGRKVDRDAVSAKVEPHADRLEVTAARAGRRVDTGELRRSVRSALVHRTRSPVVQASVRPVPPSVTTAGLRRRYAAYILIDRRAHQLRLYRHLSPYRTFPIAVGKQGLETPAGLYDVQWKEKNPIWRVPDSDWAGDLAGRNIPPGPDNPIKARWLAFNGAAGIHGIDPSEYGTIGHDASHGCVRMRIPDVIDVYDRAPVGTPVYVA